MELFETPVLFLIFNRPDLTEIVFRRIREVKPKYLYIAADGPRPSHPEDEEKCKKTRQVVLDMLDWDCEIRTLFRRENLGCGRGVSQAITWFFENVEEGIILEDDCLPDLSFFRFCKTLLAYYKDNKAIYHISGSNFQKSRKKADNDSSYYFSKYPHCWGWATWRRAWKCFEYELKSFDEIAIGNYLQQNGSPAQEIVYWKKIYNNLINDKYDSWSYRWTFKIWQKDKFAVLPNINLVENIGFGNDSTHTKGHSLNNKASRIKFPIKHTEIALNKQADAYSFKHHFALRSSQNRNILRRLNTLIFPLKVVFRMAAYGMIYNRYKKSTMIPLWNYIKNLELVYRHKKTSGVIVECGTWKGGMIAGITHIMGKDREYHLFDSFEGLPESTPIDGSEAKEWQSKKDGKYYFDNCRATIKDADEAMSKSIAKSYRIHKGWFKDTLVDFAPKEGIAVLRLDADWYESTLDCLRYLFPKVNRKGLIIIDDYYMWEGCSKAVHDFLSDTKSPCRINSFGNICFIIKY